MDDINAVSIGLRSLVPAVPMYDRFMLRTSSQVCFACQSAACAPPPVGTGGSKGGPRSSPRPSAIDYLTGNVPSSRPAQKDVSKSTIRQMAEGFTSSTGVSTVLDDFSSSVHEGPDVVLRLVDKTGAWAGDVSMTFQRAKKTVHLNFVEIAPDQRGTGLSRELLKHWFDEFRSMGIEKVTLDATSAEREFSDEPLIGAAVWGKLGFEFDGAQPRLAEDMGLYSKQTGHSWPSGLVDGVKSGTASIKDVMAADPGNFLNGQVVSAIWRGSLSLDDVSLTAAAVSVSLTELAEALERHLPRRPVRKSKGARSLLAACYSAACAPPSAGGKGGSLPGGKGGARKVAAKPGGVKPVSTETMVKVIKGTQVTEDFVDNATSSQQEKQRAKDMMTTLKATGAAKGKPRIVSAAEFERLAKESPNAVTARSAPQEAHDELVRSASIRLVPGAAQYGEGLYFAAGKGAAAHVQRNYGGGNNSTLRAIVDESSLVDINFLKDVGIAARKVLGGSKPTGSRDVVEAAKMIAHAYRQSGARLTKPEYGESHGFSDVLYEPAVLAPLLGFKGFRVKSPMLNGRKQPVDYVVILDRSALIVPG